MNEQAETFEGWMILELMGHRRLGGYVRERTVAGAGFLQIDVPADETHSAMTQLYPPASVYCMTPTTEAMARAVARRNRPEPVSRWELPAPAETRRQSWCAGCGLVSVDEPGGLCRPCEREARGQSGVSREMERLEMNHGDDEDNGGARRPEDGEDDDAHGD